MTGVPNGFRQRWQSGRHFGPWRPVMKVYVREIYMDKEFWPGWAAPLVGAKVPGESKDKPWRAKYTARSDWVELPGVRNCQIQQDLGQNGMMTCTLQIDNVIYPEANNLGYLYHLIEVGALSPWRGYAPPGRPNPIAVAKNEWYEKLLHNSQVKVLMGYGEDFLVPVFTGMVDDVDPSAGGGATLQVTIRDFGQLLVDQHVMGLNTGPKIGEPCIFSPVQPDKLWGVGVEKGYHAEASSVRDGHPARFIIDRDKNTDWISADRSRADDTEWVQCRLPRGRYESFWINPRYPNMEAWVGVYARDRNLGGEPCTLDDMSIPNGWVSIPADEGGGTTPGSLDGGWPYLKHYKVLPPDGQFLRLDCKLVVGDDSILRVGFRNLYKIGGQERYRAGATGFTGVKRVNPNPPRYRRVGFNAEASSERDGHPAKLVLDTGKDTRWTSHDHTIPNFTEYVEIHLPQARYTGFRINVPSPNVTMYISVFARNRRRKKKGGGYEYRPSQMDGVDIPEGFINIPESQGGGQVPGGHGGHAYMRRIENVGPHPKGVQEAFKIHPDGKALDLGYNSVLRVSFRELHQTSPGTFRVSVRTLKANTKSGVPQPPKPPKEPKRIEVNDISDIVRVVLRWAGFEEWEIENTGAKLSGDWVFNRQTFFIDIIKKVQEVTGFVFFMKPPTNNDRSIGVPVFRSSWLLRDDIPDLALVTQDDLLTGVQGKITDEPLASIIYVRGAPDQKGKTYLADRTKRLQAKYVPTWWRKHNRLGGVLRHVVHTEDRLTDQKSVDVYARLWALRMALEGATATAAVPGTPEFDLDDQIGLADNIAGLTTRLYVAQRNLEFTTGENGSWKLTLGGALLDTPDIVETKADLRAILPPSQALSYIGDYYEIN
jgi:hypothetical protein